MKKFTPKDIIIPAISLFIICLIVALALAFTNAVTKDRISENEKLSKEESMKTVCADAASFNEIIENTMYEGIDENGSVVGYAISTTANGYGGQIKVMIGIDTDGNISAVDVYYNDDETPGLGKNTSNQSFTDEFKGLTSDKKISVSKDSDGSDQTVDAVTSATISSRAVVSAVNEACGIYNEQKEGGGN